MRTAGVVGLVAALVAGPRALAADPGAAGGGAPPVKTLAGAAAAVADEGTTSQCIDEEIADRLAVKRKRRGAVDRLFVKQGRHEFSAMGGYYASDLFSGTWVLAGAYTYHMTDQTAVELGGGVTHANADIIRAIEDDRGQVLDDDYARVIYAESLLVWSPIYGKLRLGGAIAHFDLHVDAGVGVVDSTTSRGAMGTGGIGMKLFLGEALAFRLDARDRVFRQELLDEHFLVNDVAVTAGFSLFAPFGN
jgi:outer membrane beta-barrel protein